MARTRWRPARKALISTDGIGNRPLVASSVAAIRPRVAAGTSMPPMSTPTTGTIATTITAVMYMKNSPASASGCLAEGLDAELDPLDASARGNNVEFH